MLLAYIQAALERGTYQILPDDEGFYGEIPELRGVGKCPNLESVPARTARGRRVLDRNQTSARGRRLSYLRWHRFEPATHRGLPGYRGCRLMPPFGPIKRGDLIRALRAAGLWIPNQAADTL
jgi:hypothetical protein